MIIRKPVLPLFLLIALFTAASASAGTGLFVGANFPTGDFDNVAKTGWNAGGYFTFDLMPIVDVGATVGYTDFGSEYFDESINLWEIEALGQLKILFLKGYLGLGVANYNTLLDDRKTKFAWQMGLSAQILLIEGRLGYHQVPVDGGSFNWMSLTGGVAF